MTRERNITHQVGEYDVRREPHAWTVYRHAGTHAVSVQSFAPTPDGRTLAVAYANYKAGARGKATLAHATNERD